VIFKRVPTWAAAAAVLSVIVVLAATDPARAGTFTPELTATIKDSTPEVPSENTIDFSVPKGDVNFAGVVAYIPSDWGIVRGDKFPIGTDVGNLRANSTLGLFNSPCNQAFLSQFDFKNASLNTKDTVSFEDTDDSGTQDFAEDTNKDGNADAIDKYPDWLNRMFPGKQPIRRNAGITLVAGVPIVLQFVIFEPGTKVNDDIPADASLGYPTVVVLLNLGDPGAKPTSFAITDFCTPLTSTSFTLGKTPDGVQLFVNPKAGEYEFTAISLGLADADGDGYENSLDTCPYDKNTGNPRITEDGDADRDGLDAACDPDDTETNSDEDADGYLNRGDNCPLVANGEEDTSNQADRDLDQIGDVCDTHPDQRDGELPTSELTAKTVIGQGGAGGPPSEQACPDCFRLGQSVSSGSGGGLGTGVIIGIVAGVAAAVLVIGGAAYVLMRRRA
jgi:hypothetical protein